MPEVGVIGSLVWDEIHGRIPSGGVVEEWGGIAYALASLDAELPASWHIVPLIKVGQDLAPRAREFLGSLRRLLPGARCVEVPTPNNRVVLYYESAERRCERMAGGVPGWTWEELGPLVRGLDALYVNFISGFELSLGTAQALRHGFPGPIYADLHSLLLGLQGDGVRVLQPLPEAPNWFGCFDVIQVNEAEMNQLGPDPLSLAANMLAVGVEALIVTLGARGAVYVTGGRAVRTALIPAEPGSDSLDPTGCGDVFGGAVFSHLLAGEPLELAVAAGNRAAARNVAFRGASGLAQHLRGELVAP
ncbi:MAG TPA: carbohydrate kinase family protein [Gemmatimonadales bacterium]|nr:carbohydrate kinase family protein [Gemmatimonadales bacterium]